MLKPLTILFFLVSILSRLNAASIQDTSLPVKYKSQQWFQTKYGRDDTSKAIIDYFFLKRRKNGAPLLIAGGIAVSAGIIHAVKFNPGKRDSQPGIGLFLVELIAATMAFFFLIDYINYNKKRLTKTLDEYHSGKGVPDWLQKIYSWRKFISIYAKHEN